MPDKMKALFRGPKAEDGTPQEYLEGVPARALSQEDWDALTPDQQAAARRSGLYEVRTERDMSASGAAPAAPVKGEE